MIILPGPDLPYGKMAARQGPRTWMEAVASLRMVIPGAEFRGVSLHRLYFKQCIVGNVYECIVGRKRLYFKDGGATSIITVNSGC